MELQTFFQIINELRETFIGEVIYIFYQKNMINLDNLENLIFWLSILWWWLVATTLIGFYTIITQILGGILEAFQKIINLITPKKEKNSMKN